MKPLNEQYQIVEYPHWL